MSQVSAMTVRSNVQPEDRTENGGRGHTIDETGISKGPELDYVLMLNKVLPDTIRVIAWSPVPEDFSARFSCRGRHYRYFFTNMEGELDVDAMRKAAGYFLGENDFRNFCKLDLQKQINNFKRRIDLADIVPYDGLPPSNNSKMWTFELQGTAFLWHQVRCMMAILFLVGQRLEEPEIVRDMLDMDKYPTKPEYVMASDVPLVLYDCLFDNISWIYPEENGRVHQKDLGDCFAMWHESKLHETLTGLLCNAVSQNKGILLGKVDEDKVCVWDGSGDRKPTKSYHKVAKRKRQEAFGILNERYLKSARYENRQQKRETKAKDGLPEDDS
jgi:tRNA pseudouridine38/39 synthase